MKERIRPNSLTVYLFIVILCQPVLDILSFWSIRLVNNNYIQPLRGLLIPYGLLICWRQRLLKRIDLAYLAALFVFLLFSTVSKQKNIDGFSVTSEVVSIVKVFYFPIMLLSLYRIVSSDSNKFLSVLLRAIWLSSLIIVFSTILSLITGTQRPTYPQSWYQIGINGWFYSGNQQSLILVSILPTFIILSLQHSRKMFSILAIIGSWALLNFNGTRTAWLGSIVGSMLILFLILSNCLILKSSDAKGLILALLLIGVLSSLGFRQHIPMGIVKKINQDHYLYLQEKQQVDETKAQSNSQSDPQKVKEFELGNELAIDTTMINTVETSDKTDHTSEMDRESVKLITRISNEYEKRLSQLPEYQRRNERYRDSLLVNVTMEDVPPVLKLFGVSHQFFSQIENDIETDYALLLGAYGIVGVFMYFILPLVLIIRVTCLLNLKSIRNLFQPLIIISMYTTIILFASAYFVGRSFQQPSVSTYLSVYLTMFLISTQTALLKGRTALD